ncbi:hypothetical protein EsH8_X_000671 [Colletotrichum jinshuiense]
MSLSLPNNARQFATLLDLVKDTNKFLYVDVDKGKYWKLCIEVVENKLRSWQPFGIVTAANAAHLRGTVAQWFTFDDTSRQIRLIQAHSAGSNAFHKAFDDIRSHLNQTGPWAGKLRKYGDEKWPLIGAPLKAGMLCDVAPIFGIVTTGAHLNIFQGSGKDTKIYVARRSANKSAFGCYLDQCVAGGFDFQQDKTALDCLLREAKEELKKGLPKNLDKEIKRCKSIKYFDIRDKRWGAEYIGIPEAGIKVPFDIELKEKIAITGNKQDIVGIKSMSIDEVMNALLAGQFKPNCALIMIDFLIRHNLIADQKNRQDLAQIQNLLSLKTSLLGLRVEEIK